MQFNIAYRISSLYSTGCILYVYILSYLSEHYGTAYADLYTILHFMMKLVSHSYIIFV